MIKKFSKVLLVVSIIGMVNSCSEQIYTYSKPSSKTAIQTYKTNVIATYYHDKFNGRKTASGAIFDNNKQTAAHRTLPFGTKLKVTNRANGKWIYVTVNDRGPFKNTREIDLTKRAFMDITDNKNKGELVVDIEIVK